MYQALFQLDDSLRWTEFVLPALVAVAALVWWRWPQVKAAFQEATKGKTLPKIEFRTGVAIGLGLLALVLFVRPFVGGIGGLIPGIVAPSGVTQVTYVYEKDQSAVPSGVRAALAKLKKERKIAASEFDRDTVDGTNAVPDQYKIPLAEAEKHGLPILVVQSGDEVLEAVLKPTTEQQVLEAAQ